MVDLDLVAAYCEAYADWIDLKHRARNAEPLIRGPQGGQQPNPIYLMRDKAFDRMQSALQDLAITPAQRRRLSVRSRPSPLEEWALGEVDQGRQVLFSPRRPRSKESIEKQREKMKRVWKAKKEAGSVQHARSGGRNPEVGSGPADSSEDGEGGDG